MPGLAFSRRLALLRALLRALSRPLSRALSLSAVLALLTLLAACAAQTPPSIRLALDGPPLFVRGILSVPEAGGPEENGPEAGGLEAGGSEENGPEGNGPEAIAAGESAAGYERTGSGSHVSALPEAQFGGYMERGVMAGLGNVTLSELNSGFFCQGEMDSPPSEKARLYVELHCSDGRSLHLLLRNLGPDQGIGIGRLEDDPRTLELFYHPSEGEALRRLRSFREDLREARLAQPQ